MSPPRIPFTSVEGMEDAKKAILCALVSPNIRTVLIQGPPGTGKTALARSIPGIDPGKRLVNVPLGVADEDLLGGLDLERAIKGGGVGARAGLLAESHGNLLYIDDVNLLDERLSAVVLESVASGGMSLERDGVSASYECDTKLFATMNPLEGALKGHYLDRFDLCAFSDYPSEEDGRKAIARKSLHRADDPKGFARAHSEGDAELAAKVARAREIVGFVTISDGLIDIINELCHGVGAHGMRGSLALVNASKALAALDSRDEVTLADVESVAVICLGHRRTVDAVAEEDPEPRRRDAEEKPEKQPEKPSEQRPPTPPKNSGPDSPPPRPPPREDDDPGEGGGEAREILHEIGRRFRVIDYLVRGDGARKTKGRAGRRDAVISDDSTGRHVSHRESDGKPADVDIGATIRAAARSGRGPGDGLAISVTKDDIREKVREKRTGSTILFVMDASGSLGLRRRMAAVKGAMLSMLLESYVKRDRIGLMVFRRDGAEMVVPPTKSFEYGYRRLEDLRTGGGTPLGDALVKSHEYMTRYACSNPGEACYVVLLTDGRANVAFKKGEDPHSEAMAIAGALSDSTFDWIVVDTEEGPPTFGFAADLARNLGATYFKLEDLDADALKDSVALVTGGRY